MAWTMKSSGLGVVLLASALALAACKSSEERAQEHYETGLALLEEGDIARATVEFRNVFRLDPQHPEARIVFARSLLERGEIAQAYTQYLRVSEQFPDNAEARVELAEMAIANQDWEEGERHGEAAIELLPDDLRVKIISAALSYAQGYRENDSAAAEEAAETARALLEERPESLVAMRIVIDQMMRTGEFADALELVDRGIEYYPENFTLHSLRLQMQANLNDMAALGETLKEMAQLFPAEQNIQTSLIRWYFEQGDLDGAEAFLRELAERPDAGTDEKITVVRFLMEARDADAAKGELLRLIGEEEDPILYQALLGTIEFEEGQTDKAIADLEAIIAENEPSEDRREVKVVLARMLIETGNVLGARGRVEEILLDDPSNVEALKMRAAWLIDEDKPGDAILDLRTALSQEPQDSDILTLMGNAHERAGARDLAGERYALAVETAEQAPEESLRYATFLVQEDRVEAAKAVLVEALEKAPNDLRLMQRLAVLHQSTEDWNEVTRTIWRLRSIGSDQAIAIANGLEADMLLRQDRLDETVTFLEDLVEQEPSESNAAFAALVQTKVRAGQIDDVVVMLENRLEEQPTNRALRYLRAGLHVIQNERDEAATLYQALLEEVPGNPQAMRTLHAILVSQGREEDAAAMVDDQIEKAENPIAAMLIKAERLERDLNFDAAIELYEDIYSRNSNNIVVANNLASLITTHRDSAEDLDRAFAIARRLRDSDFPAFQDTYGWIEYRRGNYEEALTYLEPAAEGLSEHPLVQYHLGVLYIALERPEDAKRQLERALELAEDDPLPQYVRARELLEELENPSE